MYTWKRVMVFSQGPSFSRKGLAKGEAPMACTLTMWSSSSICASSTGPPLRMKVPVSFQGLSSNDRPSQSLQATAMEKSQRHVLSCPHTGVAVDC